MSEEVVTIKLLPGTNPCALGKSISNVARASKLILVFFAIGAVVASVIVNVQSKFNIDACAGVPDESNEAKLPLVEVNVKSFKGDAPPKSVPDTTTLSPVTYPVPFVKLMDS